MTRTGASTNPGGITVFAIGVPAIYGSMIAAPGFLNADQNSHQGIFIQHITHLKPLHGVFEMCPVWFTPNNVPLSIS
jgi:hypothetical protein